MKLQTSKLIKPQAKEWPQIVAILIGESNSYIVMGLEKCLINRK